jgi:hypothetical protein
MHKTFICVWPNLKPGTTIQDAWSCPTTLLTFHATNRVFMLQLSSKPQNLRATDRFIGKYIVLINSQTSIFKVYTDFYKVCSKISHTHTHTHTHARCFSSSFIVTLSLMQRTACVRAQFSGCSSTTNAHSETGQMAVCCQNLTLGVHSSRSALCMLVGALLKKFGVFLNTPRIFLYLTSPHHNYQFSFAS